MLRPKHLGQVARVKGRPLDDNPFDPDYSREEHSLWNTGWTKTNRDIIVWNLIPEKESDDQG